MEIRLKNLRLFDNPEIDKSLCAIDDKRKATHRVYFLNGNEMCVCAVDACGSSCLEEYTARR